MADMGAKIPEYKETPPVEMVVWKDHSYNTEDRLTSAQIIRNEKFGVVFRSVGMLIHEDDEKLILGFKARIEEDMQEATFHIYSNILKACIVSRQVLVGKGAFQVSGEAVIQGSTGRVKEERDDVSAKVR